jgi:hypothetical protein
VLDADANASVRVALALEKESSELPFISIAAHDRQTRPPTIRIFAGDVAASAHRLRRMLQHRSEAEVRE